MKIEAPKELEIVRIRRTNKQITMTIHLSAVLPEPGAAITNEQWLAEVEGQFREEFERKIRAMKEGKIWELTRSTE